MTSVENALKMRYNVFQPVGNAFQRTVIISECVGNVRQRVEIWLNNALQTSDRCHCHARKKIIENHQVESVML